MKKVLLIMTLLLSLMLLILTGCSVFTKSKDRVPDDEIYVKYDGGMITKADFDMFVQSLAPSQQEELNMSGKQIKLLHSMAREEAFYRKSMDLGHAKNPELIEEVQKKLKPHYIHDYYAEHIRAYNSVTDEEILAYYNENPHLFTEQAKATIQYIQAKDVEQANMILEQLERGIKFQTVSDLRSINQYAKNNNGILTFSRSNGYLPGIGEDAVLDSLIFSLPIEDGKFYGPYETVTGVHIFSIRSITDSFVKPFYEVRETAQTNAQVAKERALSDVLINTVKENNKIEPVHEVLNSINFVDTSKNTTNLQDIVLKSNNPYFKWSVKDLIEIYEAIDHSEKMFISRLSAQEIFDHLFFKEAFYFKILQEGYDKKLDKTLKYSRNFKNSVLSYTYQKLVADQIVITEEMKLDYYNENIEDYAKPPYRNIELLLFESQEKANKAYNKYIQAVNADDNSKIEKIMQQYCVNDFDKRLINNVYGNGVVPTLGHDTILNSAIWGLPVNEVSDIVPVKRNDQYALFRVIEHQPVQYKPLNHVDPQVTGKLRREKEAVLFESLIEDFYAEYNFKVYDEKLRPTLTANQLFELAEKSSKTGKLNDALLYFDQIIDSFPNNKDDYKAFFMKGFTQSEYMNDKQGAILTFTRFLDKYPKGDLNADAKVMLEILQGKREIDIPDAIELEN